MVSTALNETAQRVRRPRQDRSQQSMERILDAFEKLLRTASYEAITIADIAAVSATGAGSIYARFDGKRSILLALHGRTRDRAARYFARLFRHDRENDRDLGTAIARVARGMLVWHKRRRSVIRTSMLLDDIDIYHGISTSFAIWTEHLADMLQVHGTLMSRLQAEVAAAATLQVTTALLQQWVIFGDVPPVGRSQSDKDLIEMICVASLAQIERVAAS